MRNPKIKNFNNILKNEENIYNLQLQLGMNLKLTFQTWGYILLSKLRREKQIYMESSNPKLRKRGYQKVTKVIESGSRKISKNLRTKEDHILAKLKGKKI